MNCRTEGAGNEHLTSQEEFSAGKESTAAPPTWLRQLNLCFSLFPLHTESSCSGLLTIVLNDLGGKSKTSPEADNYYENTPVLVTRK